MNIHNKTVNISIDRLKPAYLIAEDVIPVPDDVSNPTNEQKLSDDNSHLTTNTRYGRQIKLPV